MVEYCSLVWLVLFVCTGLHCIVGEVEIINVSLTNDVLIDCPSEKNVSIAKKRWLFEETLLYTGDQRINEEGTKRVNLQTNYSLSITNVSLSDEGKYTCAVNGILQHYQLEVYVHPISFYIHVEETNLTDGSYLSIRENETLTLSCHVIGVNPENAIEWLVDNVTVDESLVEFQSSKFGEEQRIFNVQSVLQFHPVHLRGTLTCVRRTAYSDVLEHLRVEFSVYGPPTLFYMTINGSIVSDGDHQIIEAYKHFEVLCQALNSGQASNISWVIGNEKTYSPVKHLTYKDSSGRTFFNSSSSLGVRLEAVNETIACVRSTLSGKDMRDMKVHLTTFVIAQMNLFVDDHGSLEDVSVQEGNHILISCKAIGSRPSVELSIEVNTEAPSESVVLINKTSHFNEAVRTFDSMVKAAYKPAAYENGSIICSCQGRSCPEKAEIKRKFYTTATTPLKRKSFVSYLLLTVTICIATFSFALIIVFNCVKVALSNTTYFLSKHGDQQASNKRGVRLNTFLRKESNLSLRDCSNIPPGCYSSRIVSEEDCDEQTDDGISRSLPKIPKEEVKEVECAYYSESGDAHSEKKTFQIHDVCVLARINFGDLYKRWTGTLTTKEESSKCVVITTISDSKQKAGVNWIGFVQRLLDLPEDLDNLVKTEGIYVDGGKIYIIQEHLDCRSLQSFMETEPETKEWSNSTTRRFIVGILKGMEFIHSYGLLHPGISRRKVLVSGNGNCKLYDFCLAEDAAFVFRLKQNKNQEYQVPPESLQGDVYTAKSDIWSVAVVIWEILTNGIPLPIPILGYLDTITDFSYDTYLPTPRNQFGLRNDLLSQCWLSDVAKRPSFCELRASFEEISHADDLDSPYIIME